MQRPYTAGILILNWNGAELLREHLPSVLAAAQHSGLPVAVADNGSTDESATFLETSYPSVRVIRLDQNYGFGSGYNRAMEQTPWDVVVLLNNDMAVERDFLDRLLAPFESDESVFATSAQILLQDADAFRCETGRSCARFRRGQVQLRHLPIESEEGIEPIFWLAGGSAAVSRAKYLELGGFDEIYSPFYIEDIDLSYRAWKRGWPTVFVPGSKVYHKWHGSTGRLKSDYVESIFARNRLLFTWVNLQDHRMLAKHAFWFPFHCARLLVAAARGDSGARSGLKGMRLALGLAPEVRRRRRLSDQPVIMGDGEIFSQFSEVWNNSGQL